MHYVWRFLVLYFKNDEASFQNQRFKGLVTATAIWKETYGLYLWPASGDLESHLPKAIRENIPEEWRKRVASEYLDVKLLFGSDVEAALVADKLERWNLKVSVNSRTSNFWIRAYLHTFLLSYWHSFILAYLHTGILAHRHTFNSSISRGAFTPNNYKTCNRGEGFQFLPRKSRQERLMVLIYLIYNSLSSHIYIYI